MRRCRYHTPALSSPSHSLLSPSHSSSLLSSLPFFSSRSFLTSPLLPLLPSLPFLSLLLPFHHYIAAVEGASLTGGQFGGVIVGVVIGMLLAIIITAVATVVLTR